MNTEYCETPGIRRARALEQTLEDLGDPSMVTELEVARARLEQLEEETSR